ncbi:MAG: NAD-dependent epimerase/dehydratase family protein [Candidatus Binatia bacterium]
MKIVVTGATGLIGRPLVARLLESGHDVEAWSRAVGILAERLLLARCRIAGWHPTGPSIRPPLGAVDAGSSISAGEPVAGGR